MHFCLGSHSSFLNYNYLVALSIESVGRRMCSFLSYSSEPASSQLFLLTWPVTSQPTYLYGRLPNYLFLLKSLSSSTPGLANQPEDGIKTMRLAPLP